MSAGWGRLSSAILVQDWDTALEELNKLRRDIDESVSLNGFHIPTITCMYIRLCVDVYVLCVCMYVAKCAPAQVAAASLANPLESVCLFQPSKRTG